MPTVTEGIRRFLMAQQDHLPGADLIDRFLRWGPENLETQVNAAADAGDPVEGRRNTWTDGTCTWFHIRVPKNANDKPEWDDYELRWPPEEHAEGIGSTGWDWKALCSRWVGFDFDDITGHAKGVGVNDVELARVAEAAQALPYVEVRKSTGGRGLHFYVLFDETGIPTANHTEHAALARCILGMMTAEVGFDFASAIDACGQNMWLWHRKITTENQGLLLLKPATKILSIKDLPTNWRDHIAVVTRRATKVKLQGVTDENRDPFDELTSARRLIPLDDKHKAIIEALMETGYSTIWVSDHHLLQTHTKALAALMDDPQARSKLSLIGHFQTNSLGKDPGQPNCLSGDTMVITRNGSKSIRSLAGMTATILTTHGKWIDVPFRSFGVQPLLKVTLQQQRSIKVIRATPDHGWFVAGRVQSNLHTGRGKFNHPRRVETHHLQVGDKLVQVFASPSTPLTPSVVGIQHGLVWGDGSAHKQQGANSPPVSRLTLFGEKDAALLPYFNLYPQRPVTTDNGVHGIEITNLPGHFKTLVDLTCDRSYLYGWLAGYFAADGHITEDGCCLIRSYNRQSIQHVRDVCNLLGIATTPILTTKSSKSSYHPIADVFTTTLKRAHLTKDFFLIVEHRKRYLATKAAKYYAWTVKSVEPADSEEVFCCTVHETGCFALEDNILTSNCFLFPLPNGGWRVYRFSPGITETETWIQDGAGWTTCYFNRLPDVETACRANMGQRIEGKPHYIFPDGHHAIKAAEALGQKLDLEPALRDRTTEIRVNNGYLTVYIKKEKDDVDKRMTGWIEKPKYWVRDLNKRLPKDDTSDLGETDFDGILRSLRSPSGEVAGWMFWSAQGDWSGTNSGIVKMIMQGKGQTKPDAEAIMGRCAVNPWKIICQPFREEYPGGRQWNINAPQLRFIPAQLGDDLPQHPHWDMILDHVGMELTPVLQNNAWAQRHGITAGAQYLLLWIATLFREPFKRLPFLFLHGNENCGKSMFYESIALLMTKGVINASKAVATTGDFNGELAGAVLCYVEEIDLSHHKVALPRIKDWTMAEYMLIRQMRMDAYQQPNTTHWVQVANYREYCPIFGGDTRITAINVPDFAPGQEVGRDDMKDFLQAEAPHFLATLLSVSLPPPAGRLRIPVIETESKLEAIELNRSHLDEFVAAHCKRVDGERVNYAVFYETFIKWLPADVRDQWSPQRVASKIKWERSRSNAQRYLENMILLNPTEVQNAKTQESTQRPT